MHNKGMDCNVPLYTVKYIALVYTAAVVGVCSCLLPMRAVAMNVSATEFSVSLDATRLIYDPASAGATLTVTNPQDYPMLVQSKVLDEAMVQKAPFIVTPPLFRLDGLQQNKLRIVRTGGTFAPDRETLQWLCVKAIPPQSDDAWAQAGPQAKTVQMNLQLSVNACLKLLVRPGSIKGRPVDVAHQLAWQQKGQQLTVRNPTPFYMNFSSVRLGGVAVGELDYVAPLSHKTVTVAHKGSAKAVVQWKVINDFGDVSQEYRADVKMGDSVPVADRNEGA